MNEPQDSIRELSKWLNEQPNRSVDQQALARVLHYVSELERRNAMLVDALKFYAQDDFTHRCEKCRNVERIYMGRTAKEALSETSEETEAWLQAEIVKRLGEPVAWIGKAEDGLGSYLRYKDPRTGNIIKTGAYIQGVPVQEIKLYAFAISENVNECQCKDESGKPLNRCDECPR